MIRSLKNFAHLLLAITANIYYQFPSRSLKVIGVTGTDGKTTTAALIYQILKKSGKKVGVLTTISAEVNDKSYDTGFHVTTPSPFTLQKILAKAKKEDVEYFILETTSHGLDQNRVWGVRYLVSVITNISEEHLDYHKTYERYVEAKSKIILASKKIILNKDDRSYEYIINALGKGKTSDEKRKNIITYGFDEDSQINPKKYPIKPSIPGKFNLYNSLAALGTVFQLDIDYESAKKVIENYKTPLGRQDIVFEIPFTVMIDFAHTPNSFESLLGALRDEYKGKIIHVFGSAGERDKAKRPEMGKVSSKYSDMIILTAEDPRNENPESIAQQISKGINKKFVLNNNLYIIPDRSKAISFALKSAKKGDIVVVTGKGHERSMNFGEGEVPWSDYNEVKKHLIAK